MPTATINFDKFNQLQDDACHQRIRAARERLGNKAVLLCHHYQRADVYQYADLTGDSLKLARLASQTDAQYIIFCGVHFMAEVADIMSKPEQTAILPDLAAGCSMADMANLAKVERCWRELGEVLDVEQQVTAVTYINSAADLKAFCGARGGIVCTSSNAGTIATWAFGRRDKILFFPDQHLGRWTGHKMGIALDEMEVWDPDLEMGGLSSRADPARETAALERALFGAPNVPAGTHPAFSQPVSGRTGHFAPRMQLRSLSSVGLRRLDRTYRPHHQGSQPEYPLAGRHRTEPGQSPGRRSQARGQDRPVHGTDGVHVFDHATHRPPASGMDPGESGRRQGSQPDPGSRARG
jgi:quinolinate synthetase A subunit